MVGYDFEDKAYCMELTYNYGLDSYKAGTGLREFGLYVPDVAAAVKAASELGYKQVDGCVVGPDEYRFRLLALPEGRSERFLYVMQRASDLNKTVAFYKDFLGFSDAQLPSVEGMPSKAAAVSYTADSHPHKLEPVMIVFYEDGVKPEITPWEGRHAFAINADEVNALHARYKAERPGQIMHDADGNPISLQEKLGTLFIFIARDSEGYELCLVSRETMLPATIEAVTNYDPKALDWATRDSRIKGIAEAGKEVEALIKQHPVVVFSKEWCPFCRKAKNAFESIDAKVFYKELEDVDKKPLVDVPKAYQEYLAAKTNAGTSVPKAFIQGEFIGGGDDVVKLQNGGELLKRCAAAGAAEDKAAGDSNTHYFVNGSQVSQSKYEQAGL
eukprot:TRINITY_DN2552_c1_g2_i1.p1 TRINITY_DN2552_c1_g2~~TRINITY_DN2552_c1_g2_i1.p1  ORF type:complete len:386 (-),score=108.22 TRINITY_DN2552_c1_g2_i1:32-1189(-)